MTFAIQPKDGVLSQRAAQRAAKPIVSPQTARLLVWLVIATALAASVLATPAEVSEPAVALAGADLVRLMRFMAALKGLMAAGAAAAVLWRLAVPVAPAWLAGYCVACGAMVAGPGLIWSMVHVGAGAVLLHGGLLATIVLLWLDPKVAGRLDALLVARRRR